MGNPDHGATAVNFMAILQSIDYSKFERFSNVAEIKGAEKNTGQKTQLIYRKLKLTFELFDNRKVPKSFRSYLGNSNDKNNLVK